MRLPAYHGADPEAAGADMRTDAHSEREIDEFQIRESLLELIFIILQFIGVHVRIGDADLQPPALAQMGQPAGDIRIKGIQHRAEGRFHSSGFGVGIQFIPLDRQDRLQLEDGPEE